MSAQQVIAGRFTIGDPEKDLLGRGGMGLVYRAVDAQTGQSVAVKALRPQVAAEHPDLVERFVREGEALRQLDHPNIVKMVAAVEQDDCYYLVLEYVEGGSLRDLLDRQGPLPIRQALEVALDLADALTRAHRLGIVHRDLKPANVLLTSGGTPRLTDFGLARIADTPRLTQAEVIMGTIDYLSPEACRGEPLDPRTDIWAFGVLLYEMLTNRHPFASDTTTATLLAILTEPVSDLHRLRSEVTDGLADLVYRMLEKDCHQRVPSVRLVGAELEVLLKERDVISPVPRPYPAVSFQPSRFATPTPQTGERRHNLPVQPTPFVGREAELAELDRLLDDPDVRLITVLGPGGMGKTRLALEASATQLDDFAHGVYFVPLAPLKSADAIVSTMADAVGFSFHEGAEPRQQLLDYLRQKQALLIMDNFEHLLEGADLAADVLQVASDAKILATSRTRLNVQGEHLFHLSGMDFPDWETPEGALEYSAVKLFMQSARRVQPGFELEADDLTYVSRICRLVQGLPLGILLAAAWIEMLSPREIADEIERSLDFLETDLRDVPERQRSIRAVFDTSWNALSEREQEVFQALSVFRGSFSRPAAQAVAEASLRELRALVDKSLLHRAPTGLYDVHELLRQYAEEMLNRSPDAGIAARDRHAAHYAAALQKWGVGLKGPRQRATMGEMEAEIENVRAAWEWMVARDQVELVDQALDPLACYDTWRCYWHEGEMTTRLAAEAFACPELAASADLSEEQRGRLQLWTRLLAWQGHHACWAKDIEFAHRLLRQSLSLLEAPALAGQDTRREKAFALWSLGSATSDAEAARELLEQSLALYEALDDRWVMGIVLAELGEELASLGAYDEAKRLCERSLTLRQEAGDYGGMPYSLANLGDIALQQRQFAESERLMREALAIGQKVGDPADVALMTIRLGWVLIYLGKFDEALALFEKGLATFRERSLHRQQNWVGTFTGLAETHLGRYEQARNRVIGSDAEWLTAYNRLVLGMGALVMEAYAEAQRVIQENVAIFQSAGYQEGLNCARAVLGYADRGLGQPDQARQHLAQVLEEAAGSGPFTPLMYGLPLAALLLADEGEYERAVELYALACRYPFVANSRWFEDVVGNHIARAAAGLPSEVVAAARERGRARDLDATVQELLDEVRQ